MDHVFLHEGFRRDQSFTSYGSGGSKPLRSIDRRQHAARLLRELNQAYQRSSQAVDPEVPTVGVTSQNGFYLTFSVHREFLPDIEKFESPSKGVRIRSISSSLSDTHGLISIITVWIPNQRRDWFLEKLNEFAQDDVVNFVANASAENPIKHALQQSPKFKGFRVTKRYSGLISAMVFSPSRRLQELSDRIQRHIHPGTIAIKAKNAALVTSIAQIEYAVLEHFCSSCGISALPDVVQDWCEVWLACESDGDTPQLVESRFRGKAESIGLQVREEFLRFPERLVFQVYANRQMLRSLLASSDDVAEFRRCDASAAPIMRLSNLQQAGHLQTTLQRIGTLEDAAPSVCILDRGVNRGHPLLRKVCGEADVHSINRVEWGVNDDEGHGSEMAGVVAYGPLEFVIHGTATIALTHRIESVKLLPPTGENPKPLWGYFTKQAASRVEISAGQRNRCFVMAITSEDFVDHQHQGRPSSWSGSVDQLAFGETPNSQRLIILSAGNVNGVNYPDNNLTASIRSPAQSWNSLTVGAYTEKTVFDGDAHIGYDLVASKGSLSPFSRTSLTWSNKWPNKPDIVLEGGNLIRGQDGDCLDPESLFVLTTSKNHLEGPFSIINATSAAAAHAGWMAGRLQARYPRAWPETIRALLVHSASWTSAMKEEFLGGSGRNDYQRLLQVVGHGVPDIKRALDCGNNSLTMISEQNIQPFKLAGSDAKTNIMHLHQLPWPLQALADLRDRPISLKVTLSYFIDPSPEERGWRQRYRYQSHGLRFALQKAAQTDQMFIDSVNAERAVEEEAEQEEQPRARPSPSDDRWLIGTNTRHRGSIHSDIIPHGKISGLELSSCRHLAVYPVIGWWRERQKLGRVESVARYSLVVSLHTNSIDVDLYTPVFTTVNVQIPVST